MSKKKPHCFYHKFVQETTSVRESPSGERGEESGGNDKRKDRGEKSKDKKTSSIR